METSGGLSPNQFGFRRGLSTIQAVEKVTKMVKGIKSKWVIMLALDIRNFMTMCFEYN